MNGGWDVFWIIMGGVSGIVTVVSFIWFIGRGIFKQVTATEELSHAVKELTDSIKVIKDILNTHDTRIAILEDRVKR